MAGGSTSGIRLHVYRPVIVLAIVTLGAILVGLLTWGLPLEPAPSQGSLPDVDGKLLSASDGLKLLLDGYRANLDRLELNMKLQAVFIGLALLLLVKGTEKLSVIGNEIPIVWLHVVVPLALFYWWLSFGFTLNDLIEQRLLVLRILNDSPDTSAGLVGRQLLRDSGLVDGWFVAFIDGPKHGTTGIGGLFLGGANWFLVFVMVSMTSAAHACVLMLGPIAIRRFVGTPSPAWRFWYYFIPLALLACLLWTHFQFAYGGRHPNWIQFVVAGATPCACAVLAWTSTKANVKARTK